MSLGRQLRNGIRALVRPNDADRDVTDEVQHYLDEATAAHVARGLSAAEARRAAQIEIGNATVVREQVRSDGWERIVEAIAADVRYAFRRLRHNPGFAVVSVLTLALGIGATTAIFSVVDPILLESLPYPHADRLVSLGDRAQDGSPIPSTFGTFVELRSRSRSFQSMAAADRWQPSLSGVTEPERLSGQRVSTTYFRTLGVAPVVGREFADDEDQPSAARVAIISDRLAQRRFGGASVVGRSLKLDDDDYLVIGVMPPRFVDASAPATDVWSPLRDRTQAPFNSREWGHHYRIVARLGAGGTITSATRELKAISATPIQQFARPQWASLASGVLVRSLHDEVTGDVRPALLAIVGAVVLLLGIACVNVTNLLLARGAQRRAELAMRIALGAGRGRLLRQLLTESLVLAVIGGLCGLLVAKIGASALVALSPPGLPRAEAIGVDAAVFAFALATSAVIGVIVGLVPAWSATRGTLSDGVQGSSRRTAGGRGGLRNALVVAEVALALVLLVSAGLLLRSLEQLFAVAPGIRTSGLLTMQVIGASSAHSDTARRQYYERVLDATRQVPGVGSVAFTSQLPLSDDADAYGYELAATPSAKAGEDGAAFRYAVTPEYFATMGIPLLKGRALEPVDANATPEGIVINASFARRRFGNQNPIGERVRFGPETGSDRPWDVIVGVVGDVKQQSLADGEDDAFYVAMGRWWWVDNVQTLVVRTSGDPAVLAPSIMRAIWSVDANRPIERVATMDGLISTSIAQRRFALVIIETFALSALLLAAIGLYGVLSGSVSERMREIGVRSALGASRRSLLTLVVRRGLGLTAVGVVIGLAGAAAATQALLSLMFGVSRLDPLTYCGVVALLLGVATLASWLPAWRAARVDPAITLRAE
jgi:predicted permease